MTNATPQRPRKVLTDEQIEQFVDRGYVLLQEVFSAEAAAKVRLRLWELMGLSPDKPTQWSEPVVRLQVGLTGPEVDACLSDRFYGAVDDLLGQDAWEPPGGLGWWPVLFPGFHSGPWSPPKVGWHIDGIQFHHHLDSRTQGLLPIFIFSDIGPGDGGTAFRPGSHKITARILNDAEPDGLDVHVLGRLSNEHSYPQEIEANGSPGDVLLLHPFMSHATSANHGARVRFICNPCISLKEDMNLNRERREDYSPLERSIVEAIGR
jgi:hypothetical protein